MKQPSAPRHRNLVRTYLAAIGLAVVPLTAFIFGAHSLLKQETTKRLVTQSSRSGKTQAALIERPLLESATFLEAFAERPDVVRLWQQGATTELAGTLMRAHKLRPDFAGVGFYDPNGKLLVVSPPDAALLGNDYQFVDLSPAMQSIGQPYVSPAYRATHTEGYSVAVAVPLRDQQDRLVGIVVGRQSLETVTRDVYTFSTPENSALVFIVDAKGQIFGKQGAGFTLVPTNRAILDELAKNGQRETGEHLKLGSQDVIAAYSPATSVKWGVLISVPTSVLDGALWKVERQFGIFGAILLTLAAGAGLFVATVLQRFRSRELTYQQELEASKQQLEARVLERTQELQRLAAIIESTGDAIFSKTLDGIVSTWNLGAERLYGYSAAEMIGKPVEILVPRDRQEELSRLMGEVSGGKSVERYETVRVRKDGSHVHVAVTLSPVRGHTGAVTGASAIARDITKRRQSEAALEESNSRYRYLYEHMLNGFVYCQMVYQEGKARDFVYLDTNPAFTRLTGLRDAIGKRVSEVVPGLPEETPELIETYDRVAQSGQPESFEIYVKPLKAWFSIAAYSDRKGYFAASFENITERKLAEESILRLNEELEGRVMERTAQLEAANKELEAFTYSVAHDLRAPLRHIDGFAKLLIAETGDQLGASPRRYLDVICSSAQQMGTLIDELLNLSRLGRREIDTSVTGLNSIVDEVRASLGQEQAGRAVEWKIGRLPYVECDAALMRQVFMNLLSNALKYTRPRSPATIEVGSIEDPQGPVLFVRDNGVGFSMKHAEKLFGVFQRLHRSEEFEGTGVGLATVHRIVQKHFGHVWATAEVDKGATFYFRLGRNTGEGGQTKAGAA